MSDSSGIEAAKHLLIQYERELQRTCYADYMPSQIKADYLQRRAYATGAVDVLRKVMATADGQMETLG